MRDFFDSSSLLAAMIEDESGHEKALAALSSTRDGYASTHSLAECFATDGRSNHFPPDSCDRGEDG